MTQTHVPTVPSSKGKGSSPMSGADESSPSLSPPRRRSEGGFLTQYKPEQGKTIRLWTFIGTGALVAWGSYYLYDKMRIFEGGDQWWWLLITPGIPMAVLILFTTLVWRLSFVSRKPSDFMITTEGEMKKVSWSSKREIIGSTKVVIVFTFLMAAMLFTVDLLFQALFRWVGVLKG